MSIQSTIESMLTRELDPVHLEVINESSMHNVPPGSESHFRVIAASARFGDKSLVARHRLINEILAELLRGPIHALSLTTLTPDEWFERGGDVAASPPCLGGSKADS
ncbi:MAG: BolA family transcriptional regulator [Gammaproteobacteria bacterium]|nr:BolA family transcriptional regulator [Gammaproteobacteria bacterium]MDH3468138.1 BolA family transcriptional regulator [Gammaproteobacteria bacterium]